MRKKNSGNTGIRRLVEHYRTYFRIPENLNHYTDEDYKTAEKKFVKYALEIGIIES